MRISYLIVLLFFVYTALFSQPSEVSGGGWMPAQSECLSDDKRLHIQNKIRNNISDLRLAGKLPATFNRDLIVQFQFPMEWHNGHQGYGFHGIGNYVDHNPSFPGAIKDYECGSRSYDTPSGYNHSGIDYYLWPFAWNLVEDDAVKIVAAAAGVIIDKDDGNDHFSCGFNSNNWNAVYVLHDDGSTTWYGHMKENSLTSKGVGDEVEAGEFLGIVGSSGNSSAPHLHFEVHDENFSLIDPYAGPCNTLNEESWWIDQHAYIDPAINKIQTHYAPPVMHPCPTLAELNDANEFESGSQIYFVTYFKDQRSTDLCLFSIIQPDGSLFDIWSFYQPQTYFPSSWWYWDAFIPFDAMEGTWAFQCIFSGETYRHEFVISSGISAEEKVSDEGKVNIYATSDGINVENLTNRTIKKLMLLDLPGREITSFNGPWNKNTMIRLENDDQLTGIYFAHVVFDDGSFTTRKMIMCK